MLTDIQEDLLVRSAATKKQSLLCNTLARKNEGRAKMWNEFDPLILTQQYLKLLEST